MDLLYAAKPFISFSAPESAGEDAWSRDPLVEAAHGSAGFHRRLHRTRHQISRLLHRSVWLCSPVTVTQVSVYFFRCFLTVVFWMFFRFHHSQVSAQLRGHSGISAGLGQNNSLLKTGLQVRPRPQTVTQNFGPCLQIFMHFMILTVEICLGLFSHFGLVDS